MSPDLHTNSPGHIWTTLYVIAKCTSCLSVKRLISLICSYQDGEGQSGNNTGSGSLSLVHTFLQWPSQHFCNTAYLCFMGLALNKSVRVGVDLSRTRQKVWSFIQSPSIFCRDRGNPRKQCWKEATVLRLHNWGVWGLLGIICKWKWKIISFFPTLLTCLKKMYL